MPEQITIGFYEQGIALKLAGHALIIIPESARIGAECVGESGYVVMMPHEQGDMEGFNESNLVDD